jgi:hypothetical protein
MRCHTIPGNYRGTRKVGDISGSRTMRQARTADMRALEALPAAVRQLLNELAIPLSAESVLAYYQSILRQARDCGGSDYDAEVWTLRKLAQIEAEDQNRFALGHRQQYRADLPHEAADASVLRYGPLERSGRKRVARHVAAALRLGDVAKGQGQ